jgi:hypothetical protein
MALEFLKWSLKVADICGIIARRARRETRIGKQDCPKLPDSLR